MRVFFLITSVLYFWLSSAQEKPKKTNVLLTINNEEILADEFLNVYNKNIQLVQDDGKKDIED